MKNAFVAASAVCLVLSGAALAQDNGQSIVIEGSAVTLEQWSADVTRDLESNIRYPASPAWQGFPSGIVSVTFKCGEDGKPVAVALTRDSGNRALDRAALRAVSSITSLHPLPAGLTHRQNFQANVVFATDPYDLDQHLAALRREQSRHDARVAAGESVIALNVGLRTPG